MDSKNLKNIFGSLDRKIALHGSNKLKHIIFIRMYLEMDEVELNILENFFAVVLKQQHFSSCFRESEFYCIYYRLQLEITWLV